MLTLIFGIGMLVVMGKILWIGLQAAWGITKFLVNLILLPVVLIAMAVFGFMSFAFVILVIVGIIAIVFGG